MSMLIRLGVRIQDRWISPVPHWGDLSQQREVEIVLCFRMTKTGCSDTKNMHVVVVVDFDGCWIKAYGYAAVVRCVCLWRLRRKQKRRTEESTAAAFLNRELWWTLVDRAL